MKSFSYYHYNINTGQRDCVKFNMESDENPYERRLCTMSLDRLSTRALVDQAMKKPVKISKHISFKLHQVHPTFEPERTSFESYEAALCYNDVPFLISIGANGDLDHEAWDRVMTLAAQYKIDFQKLRSTPTTFIADILGPTQKQEIMCFMYHNNCRNFTRSLGLTMLTPESARF